MDGFSLRIYVLPNFSSAAKELTSGLVKARQSINNI